MKRIRLEIRLAVAIGAAAFFAGGALAADPAEGLLEKLASKKPAVSNRAAAELLKLGPEAEDALRVYAARYPDNVNVARQSRWKWRAARRCERLLRLLEEDRIREEQGVKSSAEGPFLRTIGLPPAEGRPVFEEALIPNRPLMELAAEAADLDWAALDQEARTAFRKRFETAWQPVAERWERGVRLDAFTNPGKGVYPMSDVVTGDLLCLLFARLQVPDAWTLDWYVAASGHLANWRDFEKLNPRVSRLEVTLREKTPLTAALETLVRGAAMKSETMTGRAAATRVALANRLKPMALDLAMQITEKDLPAYGARREAAPDPASGKVIGTLEDTSSRMRISSERALEPGEYLVAVRDGEFVGWLTVARDGIHAQWQTAYVRTGPEDGDAVALPPENALLPDEQKAAKNAWFAAVHTLFSYGTTMEHLRTLKEYLAVDGRVYSYSGMYRIRDFAMMGLLHMTGQDVDAYAHQETDGVCPWASGGLRLPEFGSGESWEKSLEQMAAWFDANVADADEANIVVPPEQRPEVDKSRSLKIRFRSQDMQFQTVQGEGGAPE